MQERSVIERAHILEQKVEALETLPTRVSAVELQLLRLRDEVRGGFSAVRQEMSAMGVSLRDEIRAGDSAVRTELRAEMKALRAYVDTALDSTRTELQTEIRDGDEETRRYMRVLHEEVLSRIAMIHEGPRRRNKP